MTTLRKLSRLVGQFVPYGILVGIVLLGFSRLVAEPSGLMVDLDRPSVDTHIRGAANAPGNDLTRQYLPRLLVHGREFEKWGHLPAWDDTGFGGRPSVGNPQAGLFYPPVWPIWWLARPAGLGWLTVLHLAWAGLGVYSLARASGLGKFASLTASGCVQICPYVISQASEGHYPHLWTFSWYPWAFWAIHALRRRDWSRGLLLTPILAMAYFTGHSQEWFYLVLTLMIYGVWEFIWIQRGRWRTAGPAGLGASIVLSIGMVALDVVPAAFCAPWTLRGAQYSIAEASGYHLEPLNLLHWISPKALGGHADYIGLHNLWETQFGFGWPVLLLSVVALLWSRQRSAVMGWGVLFVASGWFAFGSKLGLSAVAYYLIPGIDRFRVPARSLFLANLAAGMLAGYGVEAWVVGSATERGLKRLVSIHLLATVFIIIAIMSVRLVDPWIFNQSKPLLALDKLAHEPVVWLVLAGTVLLSVLSVVRPEGRRLWALGLVLLALTERIDYARSVIVVAPLDRIFSPDPIAQAFAGQSPQTFRIRADDSVYPDLDAFKHGIMKTNCYDSFQIQHAADLYETLYPMFENRPYLDKVGEMAEVVATYRGEVRQCVLDRMAVRFLVAGPDQIAAGWPLLAEGTWKNRDFAVFENRTALPRAYVVPTSVSCRDEAQTVLSTFRFVNPREAVLMESDPLGPMTLERQRFTPAEWDSTDPDHVQIHVTTEAPGLLVIADTFMPGWSATVDGHSVPIFRGNHAQRVVAIDLAGRHEIRLDYRPPGFRLGLAVTTSSVLIWIMLVVANLRRPGRSLGIAGHLG